MKKALILFGAITLWLLFTFIACSTEITNPIRKKSVELPSRFNGVYSNRCPSPKEWKSLAGDCVAYAPPDEDYIAILDSKTVSVEATNTSISFSFVTGVVPRASATVQKIQSAKFRDGEIILSGKAYAHSEKAGGAVVLPAPAYGKLDWVSRRLFISEGDDLVYDEMRRGVIFFGYVIPIIRSKHTQDVFFRTDKWPNEPLVPTTAAHL